MADSRSSNEWMKDETHNYSKQEHVVRNPDPALDIEKEHHHAHLHHDKGAVADVAHEPVYTKGTTFERSHIPDQEPIDHRVNRRKNSEKAYMMQKDTAVDPEKNLGETISPTSSEQGGEGDPKSHPISRFYRRYRIFFHLIIWGVFTGWWIASLVLHRHDMNWIIPFLLYLCISLRILFFHVPITVVTTPMHFVWNNTGVRVNQMIPEKWRLPLGALVTIATIIVGAFASPESEDNTRENRAVSLFGLLVFLSIMYATSRNRKLINWHTVITGMLIQFIIALFVLRTQAGFDIFQFVSGLARDLLGFAQDGVAFLTSEPTTKLSWFLISVVPAIIFFVSFVQLFYYFGTIQWFIGKTAVFFFWAMRVSGAEAVVASASPFIGQGESAILIKPFVPHLTMAELHQVMCSGFATIAGSVLVAYIALGINGEALISSCVMSIPASLAISKLRWPEEEETLTSGRVVIPDDEDHKAANALHAFTNGAWLGLKIGGMIIATLLCILALVGLINGLLTWWGHYINIGTYNSKYDLTLELILGYICYPISFLLGVSREGDDLILVAQLIGIKIVENEFVAYDALKTMPQYQNLSPRSRLIATYALCGFGNLGSLGNQIGVLAQISPGRSGDVSRIAVSALFSGILSTLTSASIAGLLVTNQAGFTASQPAS